MKIKNVEDFSLEECREYLNTHPAGSERTVVEARLNTILQQKRYSEEQKEKQRRLEQERLSHDVRWIDIKQFLSNHKYRKLSSVKIIVWLPLLIAVFILSASIYFSNMTYMIFATSLGVIIPAILILRIIHFLNSPSLPNIYNIEQEEKTKSIRRTQNRTGKFGLHLCKKRRIIQLLPMKYNNIYYCCDNAYICVKGNKSGVYNTQAKKMVLNIEYDSIEIVQNGTLVATKNGVLSRFTTDGYRIIE